MKKEILLGFILIVGLLASFALLVLKLSIAPQIHWLWVSAPAFALPGVMLVLFLMAIFLRGYIELSKALFKLLDGIFQRMKGGSDEHS